MLQYVVAGLVLGGIYAIASAGLVITYVSSGILNFAFGALAFFVARFYYYLHVQEGWGFASALSWRSWSPARPSASSSTSRLPLSQTLLATGQGGGHARSPGGPPRPHHADLRQRGDLVRARARSRAGPGLRLHRRGRHVGPGHRLRLRRGDGHHRLRRPPLHRRGPQSAGHGGLPRHDRPVGHQPRSPCPSASGP